MFILLFLLLLEDHLILKMTFTGDDRELAQGAIERHDLLHREVQPKIWLIAVEEGSPEDWARRLNATLPPNSGRFEGTPASSEEVARVRRGEIQLQR